MDDYIDVLNEFLKKTGQELTPQIKQVTDIVFDTHEHFTLQDLQKNSKIKDVPSENINNILEQLIESGLIRKIFYQDHIYFEQIYGHAHHDHLICAKCSKVTSIYDEIIEKEQQRIVNERGYELLKHSLTIVGICPECLAGNDQIDQLKFQKEDKGLDKKEIIPLSMVPGGEKVIIARLEGGKGFINRLLSMGLSVGIEVEVLSNDFQGPFLLKVNETRLGIGHALTHKIYVKK